MSEFIDDIFSKVVSSSSVETLSSSEQIVPDGFSALDFKEWSKPLLDKQKYNMRFRMRIPIVNYLYNKEKYYNDILSKLEYLISNLHIYKHSDVSLTYLYKNSNIYLNWYTRRPINLDNIDRFQICIAFKRKDINFRKFLDFTLSICSTIYSSSICDIDIKISREFKPIHYLNNIWIDFNCNELYGRLLDIKTVNICKNTSVYFTHKDFENLLKSKSYYNTKQKNYELKGLDEWFEKWSKKYNNAFR